jgi:DMSO/TMAO reductase YedYZ molybdopterin-dependent catalytic subunit
MTGLGTGAVLCGFERLELVTVGRDGAGQAAGGLAGGELVGRVEFLREGPVEMNVAFGSELDGRLLTALEELSEKNLVTPEERFYLRTRASKILPDAANWTVAVDGLTAAKRMIGIAELRAREKPQGLHLMECSGNTRAAHFGMISVGDWAGVALSELLGELKPQAGATRALVNGFDQYVGSSATSVAGASWIFTFEELKSAGAFLATKLDGAALTRDHGAPVRLVVPGWYGCTCIKWVNRITFVDDAAAATSQMAEYAGRTHQKGSPRLAREFEAARIDAAAMPIRVEKWRIAGRVKYRVVGLLWGGMGTVRALGIRFNPEEEFVRVQGLPVPQNAPWTLWWHDWSPAERGTYTIRLAVLEPGGVRTRRLDTGYYARSVEIEEV